MRGFRARDADRDGYVELIEAAYVDGQIGDADRELRVGRALSAETLDELQTLTRDLQRPAGFVAAADRPAPPRARGAGPAVVLLVAGFLVFLVLGVVGALVLFAASSEQDSATSGGVAAAPDPVASAQATEVPAASFTMTAPQVRTFLRAYERKFGTLDVWEVGFYPDRVGVQVPVSSTHKRFERWSWDGTWRQDTEASAVIGPQKFVSLGPLDVRRLFDNIARARRTLGVPDGRLTHVLVNDWGQGPGVNIYIGNTFNETGYLRTGLGGDIVRSYPYDG